ncbi:MAG: TlpA family protein disulfide reductase [Aureispira sp.]|nr:TlpA family protein disulfide reductase [Aureispira sp.]
MLNKLYLILVLSTLFVSCENGNNTPKEATESVDTFNILRTPDEVVQKDGITVNLYSYDVFKRYLEAKNDTIYVVNFWATWCKPCVEELPSFEALYQNYKDKKVRLILVSLDFEKEIESKLIPFMDKHKLKGEVLVLKQKGMNNWIDKIDPSWSGALPATIIYNKDKRAFFEQSFDYKELEERLQEFL